MKTRGCTCQRAARRWIDGRCAACGSNVLEEQLIPALLQILTGGTGLVLWRNPRGYDERTKTKYGLAPGAADYIGLYSGWFVAVEFKTEVGRQSKDQISFEALINRTRGIYAIVRTECDAHELLTRLRTEVPK